MKNIIISLLVVFLGYKAVVWVYEAIKPDYWMGVYYPVTADWKYSPKFQTKEECVVWAQNHIKQRPQDLKQDVGYLWECNKNCELSEDYEYLLKNAPDLVADRGPMYTCEDGGFDDGDWGR